MKLPSRKITRLEHATRNVFKSLTNPVNQDCPEFVVLNKKATYEKFERKILEKIKGFGNQGFFLYKYSAFE